jgi:hypothetical protein
MGRLIKFSLSFLLLSSSLKAGGFSELKMNSAQAYQPDCGTREEASTNLGASMIGWGIGLAVGIAILSAVLHQSKAKTPTTPTTN